MTLSWSTIIIGHGPLLGDALAEAFIAEGYDIGLVARNAARLDEAAAKLSERGAKVTTYAADAGDHDALSAALDAARRDLGAPEVLIYNAASSKMQGVLDLSAERLIDDFRAGVSGALVAARHAAPAMIERGRGTLLFTGGMLALAPMSMFASMSIIKGGIRALALMLADELAPKNVRVGTVTIGGAIARGTAFDPSIIARSFVALHKSPPRPKMAEIVLRG
ncbi:SDR family NAD(P)-dependent oxidoreductase [Mesorhizobium sp. M4A.F.Ca.ET.020.02.1.1]|uniref:SDR family NAD(P)-dependent oxidoreductase n=1 Tax=unclassified Mesorhizobium TaxID=325217 RepID=UPI000FD3FDFF|nr:MULTISPECIES: SDR family NAD(P)-dependent oxidoreductase [unclassified Mesorhizobium]RVD31597.1 SDR family NAD(P)-dependent oxidoreductase [Mesorhizobium sp. M4A.F.Ca.ET.020.02.1.1]RWC17083.1 MAG: SDR family NAD(P)-dependent oxidoreductase [Mesorhizobium sp.]